VHAGCGATEGEGGKYHDLKAEPNSGEKVACVYVRYVLSRFIELFKIKMRARADAETPIAIVMHIIIAMKPIPASKFVYRASYTLMHILQSLLQDKQST